MSQQIIISNIDIKISLLFEISIFLWIGLRVNVLRVKERRSLEVEPEIIMNVFDELWVSREMIELA